jgi:hypothetical protein
VKKKPSLKLADVKPGNWRGEILGSCTVNFGQVAQPGPPKQSVEFTYIIMPAAFNMPEARFTRPGRAPTRGFFGFWVANSMAFLSEGSVGTGTARNALVFNHCGYPRNRAKPSSLWNVAGILK